MTTIKEVAEYAGVSFKTVSRVLNNNPNVSEKTRAKVLAAIDALGYRPNVTARTMRTGKSHFIGFINDEIATQPHAGNIILGAQRAAQKHDKLLLVINTEQDPELEDKAVNMMLERQVDAIIYAAMYHREVNPPQEILNVPCVLVDCFVDDYSITSVIPDEVRGGREATLQLLEQGHRRVGFINNEDQIPATFGRLKGYQEALEQYGIAFDPELVVYGKSDSTNGYQCAGELLDIDNPPTAIFCFNDQLAMGAYDAINQRGLRIPDDISIIGFDNLEIIAASLYPALTTMELPHFQMGEWAVNYLMNNEQDFDSIDPIHHKMECPLILRDSITSRQN